MRSRASLSVVLLLVAASVFAAPPRLAVTDFTVSSENPRLKFVGKGLAEMIAAELAQAKGIALIDRDRRMELLQEQEFALSEAADLSAQVKIGRILSADYLLYGEIVDMDSKVLVTARVVSVETGQVTWADKILSALADYDIISSQFARGALESLGTGEAAVIAAQPAVAKIEPAKKEEAIVAFSRAVDSYDRKDTTEAKRQLRTARSIDPTNRAVALYARKLGGASPRFQVELDKYAPSYNPGSLGLMEAGSVYLWESLNPPWEMIAVPEFEYGDYRFHEMAATNRLGTLLPLGQRLGMSCEVSWSITSSDMQSLSSSDLAVNFPGSTYLSFYSHAMGVTIGVGWAPTDALGFGLGARIAAVGPWNWITSGDVGGGGAFFLLDAQGFYPALDGGIVYKSPSGIFGADLHAIWSSTADPYIDPTTSMLIKGSVPLILAGSVTGGFLDRTLFANLRCITDIYIDDRSGWALRAIPSLEWWPLEWLALRAAYEYAQLSVSGFSANGHGVMAGATGAFGRWDVNLNYVYRFRPYRLLLGQGNIDKTFLLGVSWNGITRRAGSAAATP
jgi:TolB-like protein